MKNTYNVLIGRDVHGKEFDKFLTQHVVFLRRSNDADKAHIEGYRFGRFLEEFCDPAYLEGLRAAHSWPPGGLVNVKI